MLTPEIFDNNFSNSRIQRLFSYFLSPFMPILPWILSSVNLSLPSLIFLSKSNIQSQNSLPLTSF